MSLEYPCVYYDNEKCQKFSDDKFTSWCVLGPCGEQKLSNADRIRAMSDEELAMLIWRGVCDIISASDAHCEYTTCYDCVLGWIKQPVKDGEGE